jgi:hypothetical protein
MTENTVTELGLVAAVDCEADDGDDLCPDCRDDAEEYERHDARALAHTLTILAEEFGDYTPAEQAELFAKTPTTPPS